MKDPRRHFRPVRAGMTLIEIMVAGTVFATIIMASMFMIGSTSRVVVDSTIRAEESLLGSDRMVSMVRKLQTDRRSALGAPVGTYTGGGSGNFTPDSGSGTIIGRAICMQAWSPDTSVNPVVATLDTKGPYVYAFMSDGQFADGETKMKLVFMLPGTTQDTTILRDIWAPGSSSYLNGSPFAATAETDANYSPKFELQEPANLKIRFHIRRLVDFDQKAAGTGPDPKYKFVVTEHVRNVYLRNEQ